MHAKDTKIVDDQEDLPPYSFLAPDLNVKRRKKQEQTKSYKEEDLSLQNMKLHQKVQKDNLNCQTSTGGECVWIYNQSQVPIFVTSPTLEPIPSDQLQSIPSESGTGCMLEEKGYDRHKLAMLNLGKMSHLYSLVCVSLV